MTMRKPRLYNVVDTEGRTKGLKNNLFPLNRRDAKALAARQPSGKPKLVPVEQQR